MSVESRIFGKNSQGGDIFLYTITNSKGMQASVTDFGAILVSLIVPTKDGKKLDVVLGYDIAEKYFDNECFFGSTIGPNANRIANARFSIDGKEYQLDVNDNANNLHSHRKLGYHKRMWHAQCGQNSVTFMLSDEDGSMGFPGNKKFAVTYTLGEDDSLSIHYEADSDRETVINPTNHSYFNLNGQGNGKIEDHILQMTASHYTPVIKGAIPTGEIAPVEGTPMDFRTPKQIGRDINADFPQLGLTGGYDHNWVIDDWDMSLREFATVKAQDSGLVMKVSTTLPGVQFYAGNGIASQTGKNGKSYAARSGFCLETQYFPDSVNEPGFPSCIFGGGRSYESTTVYRFE